MTEEQKKKASVGVRRNLNGDIIGDYNMRNKAGMQKRIGEAVNRKGLSYDPEDAFDRQAERAEKSYNDKHGKNWWDGAWAMRSESLGQHHDEQKEDEVYRDISRKPETDNEQKKDKTNVSKSAKK